MINTSSKIVNLRFDPNDQIREDKVFVLISILLNIKLVNTNGETYSEVIENEKIKRMKGFLFPYIADIFRYKPEFVWKFKM